MSFKLKAAGGSRALDRIEVRRALEILIGPGEYHELRGLGRSENGATWARSHLIHYGDWDAAVDAAYDLSDGIGLYYSLNPVQATLGDRGASARHVTGRRWLLIDVDRKKEVCPDESAAEGEKASALDLACVTCDWLTSEGWPSPVITDSGNGSHLLYRLDLPADRPTHLLIQRALRTLATRWTSPHAEIDFKVFDASRIARLPGSWSRKGTDTPERPHRLSRLLYVPPAIEIVTLEQLEAVAGDVKPARQVFDPWKIKVPETKTNKLEAYVRSAVERELARVVLANPGNRNNQLNTAAFAIGQLVGARVLDQGDAERQLIEAAQRTGLPDSEIARTVGGALDAGIRQPRSLPSSLTMGAAANGTAKTPPKSNQRDATVDDLAIADAGTRWLWKGWIPLGVLTLLTAEPSTGKTRLGLDLTKRIVLGLPWPDNQPMDLHDRNQIVIWVPADNQHCELVDCSAAFGFPGKSIILNTTIDNIYGGTELVEQGQLDDLEARINRHVAALVLIDTITNTSDAKSQDTSDAKRQYKPLQDVAKRTGCAMICVTHTNIAGKTLGRRADEKTRVTIRMTCPDPEHQPLRRRLEVALTRLSEKPAPLGVTMGNSGNEYDSSPPESVADGGLSQRPTKLPSPAAQEAIGYLTARLRTGPEKISTIRAECEHKDPPIDAKQLYAAKKYLPIEEYEQEDVVRRKVYKWWKLNKTPDQPIDHDTTPY